MIHPLVTSPHLLRCHGQPRSRIRNVCRETGFTALSFLRGNQNHTVTGTRTVNRSRRSVFQHLDRLNHRRVQIRQRVGTRHRGSKRLHRDSIHHVQRRTIRTVLPLAFNKQRVVTANGNHGTTATGRTGNIINLNSRHMSLEQIFQTMRRHLLQILPFHRRNCTDDIPLPL